MIQVMFSGTKWLYLAIKRIMIIKNDKTIEEIQEEFSILYPGLQLKFYSRKHDDHAGSPKKYELDNTTELSKLKSLKKEGFLAIHKSMSVSDLEQAFEKNFGLHVQVFRLSKDLWLQTVATDDWTLEEQNRKGIYSNQERTKDGY